MFVDLTNQEYVCRIVYFGPGLSGKSSNITALRQHLHNAQVEEPEHIDNEGERILRCLIRPGDLPVLAGLRGRVEVVTNPGRSYYNANRRELLNGADGIIFVADSRREAIDENIDAMNDLWAFLNHHQIGPDIPLVIQFNKQDLGNAIPFDQLNPLLNSQMKPSFAAAAHEGRGVLETYQALYDDVRSRLDEERVRREVDRTTGSGKASSSELNLPALSQSPPPPAAAAPEESWLLTCFSCDSVLEVPRVKAGDLFTCGSCNSVLQVVDPDTGETQPHQTGSTSAASTPDPSGPQSLPSNDEYLSLPEPSGAQSALQSASGAPPPTSSHDFSWQDPHSQSIVRDITGSHHSISSGPVELVPKIQGFEFHEQLDSSLVGTRFAAIEVARNRPLRALALNPVMIRQPGYQNTLEPHLRMAGQVRHPNLVPVLAVRWWNEIPVIFSISTPEYEPLSLILARRRTLAPPQAMGIIRQLALALEEAARAGVVHGWIRPDAVLINPAGSVLLDDLVVPKNPGFLVRESMGGSASTEYYLAPEQLHGSTAPDVRTDIFLLGALLFRMVTGEGLVTGYNAHEALHKISTNGPRRMREVNSEISRELDNFFLRLVAIDCKDRLQRHQELITILEKFGGGAKRNTMRAARHPNTARVTRRRAGTGTGTGSGSGSPTMGHTRRGLSGASSYQEEEIRRRGKKGGSPTMIIILLLALVVVIAAFLFKDSFSFGTNAFNIQNNNPRTGTTADPYPQGNRPPATTQQQPTGPTTPAPTVERPTGDPVEVAKAMLAHYEQHPDDKAAESELIKAIGELRRNQATRGAGMRLYDDFNLIRERHNTGGTVATTPTTPTDPQPPTTTDPTPTDQVTPNPAGPTDEPVPARVRMEISELLTKEAFAQATTLVDEQIPAGEQADYYHGLIAERHDAARKAIARLVRAESDLAKVAAHLEPALQTWGMPGDAVWAAQLLGEARQRIENTPASTDDDTTPTVVTPSDRSDDAISTIDGIPIAIVLTDAAINRALLKNDLTMADRLVSQIPAGAEQDALALKVELARQAPAVMGEAFVGRNIKSRVKTPFANQQWDVAAVTDQGIKVTSPKGEQTTLTWAQLDPADVGKLYDKIASARPPESKPIEDAIAAISLLISDNAGLANIAASRARKAHYDKIESLGKLMDFQRRHKAALLIDTAERALAANEALPLAQSLTALQSDEKLTFSEKETALKRYRSKTDPGLMADLGENQQQSGTTEDGPGLGDRDQLTFKSDTDLLAFPIRDGSWKVENDALRAGRGTCSLLRSDLQTVNGLSVEIACADMTGELQIDFRGTTFVFDFAKKGFSARNAGAQTAFVPFPVIPELPYKIDFTLQDGTLGIEVNSTESIQLAAGQLSDQLRITALQAKDLSINQLTLQRSADMRQQAPRSPIADVMEQALGWSPVGEVELKAPRIILRPAAIGRSAIIRKLQSTTIGMTFDVQGDGKLVVMLGERGGDIYEAELSMPPGNATLHVSLRWTKQRLTISTRDGDAVDPNPPVIFEDVNTPREHLILAASGTLTFLSPPQTIKASQ